VSFGRAFNTTNNGCNREVEQLLSRNQPPRDLEMLKLEVQADVERTYREALSRVEAERDKAQQMYFDGRRKLELKITEFEQFTIDQGQIMQRVHDKHQHEVRVR
jgi:hypothetical protein